MGLFVIDPRILYIMSRKQSIKKLFGPCKVKLLPVVFRNLEIIQLQTRFCIQISRSFGD